VSAFLPLEVYSFFQANNLAKAQETIIAKGKLSETPVFFFLKVARARKVVDRSLLPSKGPEAPVLHEGRARARARALSTRDIFDRPKKGRINEFFNSLLEIGKKSARSCQQ
jgi:hypothetical protein